MDIAFTSGNLSTSGIVRTGPGQLTHAQAGDQVFTFYDGTSTNGTQITRLTAFIHADFPHGVQFNDGLYVSVASTTSNNLGGVVHMI